MAKVIDLGAARRNKAAAKASAQVTLRALPEGHVLIMATSNGVMVEVEITPEHAIDMAKYLVEYAGGSGV